MLPVRLRLAKTIHGLMRLVGRPEKSWVELADIYPHPPISACVTIYVTIPYILLLSFISFIYGVAIDLVVADIFYGMMPFLTKGN